MASQRVDIAIYPVVTAVKSTLRPSFSAIVGLAGIFCLIAGIRHVSHMRGSASEADRQALSRQQQAFAAAWAGSSIHRTAFQFLLAMTLNLEILVGSYSVRMKRGSIF